MGLQIRRGTTCLMVATSYTVRRLTRSETVCVYIQPENKNERNNIYDYKPFVTDQIPHVWRGIRSVRSLTICHFN